MKLEMEGTTCRDPLLYNFISESLLPLQQMFDDIQKEFDFGEDSNKVHHFSFFGELSFAYQQLKAQEENLVESWELVRKASKYTIGEVSAVDSKIQELLKSCQEWRDIKMLQALNGNPAPVSFAVTKSSDLTVSGGSNRSLDEERRRQTNRVKHIREKYASELQVPIKPDTRLKFELQNFVLNKNLEFERISNGISGVSMDMAPLVSDKYSNEVSTRRYIFPRASNELQHLSSGLGRSTSGTQHATNNFKTRQHQRSSFAISQQPFIQPHVAVQKSSGRHILKLVTKNNQPSCEETAENKTNNKNCNDEQQQNIRRRGCGGNSLPSSSAQGKRFWPPSLPPSSMSIGWHCSST